MCRRCNGFWMADTGFCQCNRSGSSKCQATHRQVEAVLEPTNLWKRICRFSSSGWGNVFQPLADAPPGEMVSGNLLEDWEMRQLAEREQQEMALLERELLRPELPLNTVSPCCSLRVRANNQKVYECGQHFCFQQITAVFWLAYLPIRHRHMLTC